MAKKRSTQSQTEETGSEKTWLKWLSAAAAFIMVPSMIFQAGWYCGEAKTNVQLAKEISDSRLKEVDYKEQIMRLNHKIDSIKLENNYGKQK